jgi:hypothetical protein
MSSRSVMKSEPEWQALPAETPLAIRALLRRCLQKRSCAVAGVPLESFWRLYGCEGLTGSFGARGANTRIATGETPIMTCASSGKRTLFA